MTDARFLRMRLIGPADWSKTRKEIEITSLPFDSNGTKAFPADVIEAEVKSTSITELQLAVR